MRFKVLLAGAALMALSANADTGSFKIHMILHAVGEERYEVSASEGGLKLSTTFEYSDRGNKRSTAAELRMKSDYTPLSLEVQGRPNSVHVDGSSATVHEDVRSRTLPAPEKYFAIFGPSPFAVADDDDALLERSRKARAADGFCARALRRLRSRSN